MSIIVITKSKTMEREPRELFSKVLWTAQEALDHYTPERKVYPAEAIFEAFDLSKLDFDLCNYRTHIFTVARSFDKVYPSAKVHIF